MIHELVLYVAMQEITQSMCGGGWLNQCTLISQCTGVQMSVQPHPASQSNQSDSGQVRLLKPSPTHTHYFVIGITLKSHFIALWEFRNGVSKLSKTDV